MNNLLREVLQAHGSSESLAEQGVDLQQPELSEKGQGDLRLSWCTWGSSPRAQQSRSGTVTGLS